jgi:hypothetical protein
MPWPLSVRESPYRYPARCLSYSPFVGLSISAPGGDAPEHAHGLDTEAFFKFLERRGSGIITVPSDRWNAKAYHGTGPGKICTVFISEASS